MYVVSILFASMYCRHPIFYCGIIMRFVHTDAYLCCIVATFEDITYKSKGKRGKQRHTDLQT